MTEDRDLLAPETPADLTTCDREPIHTPDLIQSHGALLVARATDLRITHASANLGSSVLGRSLIEVVGSKTYADIEAALHDDVGVSARICSGILPTPEGPHCDLVVHEFEDRIYVEFEPFGEEGERDMLLARAHAVMQAMRRAPTRQELCERAVREVMSLTGYDRVMAYRFDADGHGEVIAEVRADGLPEFLGLRYPASDIPKQARRLYLQQRVRVIADVGDTPVAIRADPALPDIRPLDLSFSNLRATSPLHAEYLNNMGVGATLAISLIQDNSLWGMLICHHQTPRRVSAHLRGLCDLIGQVMSLLIGAKGQAELLEERVKRQSILDTIRERAMSGNSIAAALTEQPDILRLVGADGVMIRLGGHVKLLGRTPDLPEATSITAALRAQSGGEIVATNSLGTRLPEFAHLSDLASGVLTLPSLHNPEDAVTWFRQEAARTVTWGGNPEKAVEEHCGRLSPRKSFAAWTTVLSLHALPWQEADLQSAEELRRIITTSLLRQMETQACLAHLRLYDPLTSLPNRRFLQERLEARQTDPAAPDAAMIFLDLDRFKNVNDTLGHAVGDDLLVQVANRMIEIVPEQHTVARLGGDEFVVLCENLDVEAVGALADRIIAGFRSPFLLAGRPYRLTTSIGVAPPSLAISPELLHAADTAMYAAKQKGGNRAVIFDSDLHNTIGRRLELEQDLHAAVEMGQFELHYQPLVNVCSGEVFAFEALVRWRHPTLGLVPPAGFINLAEETRLIEPIGAWVLQEALRQVGVWRQRYRRDLVMSVNVSGHQTSRPDFPSQVAQALAAAELPPTALLIEVTESILTQSAAVAHLKTVRDSGVRIAIDDFGTGYSSLAHLQKLPVDEMKVDKLFIERLGQDGRQTEFVNLLVQLAHTLDLRVIAEGVENECQWRTLQSLGCDAGQGFWLGRPMPADRAEAVFAISARSRAPLPPNVASDQASRGEPAKATSSLELCVP